MEEKRGGVPKRNQYQREQDLIFIAPLLIDGIRQAEIAKRLTEIRDYNVSQQMVAQDTKKLLDAWKGQRAKIIDSHKELMIERAEKMWAIAVENWELSKKGKTKTIKKQKNMTGTVNLGKGKGKKAINDVLLKEQQHHHTESIGDPAWYTAMGEAWDRLYEALDLKNAGNKPEGLEAAPPTRDVYFVTVSRKNNDQYAEAEEIPEEESGDSIQKLIQS